jgi:hypothetical protein
MNSHKTAISRNKPSKPMRLLHEMGCLTGQKMDYGCGKGRDADFYGMSKYDPYYFPIDHKKRYAGVYNTITCHYVLNVLPKKEEKELLSSIKEMLVDGGKAYITVRRDIIQEGVTKKGTFQRNVKLDLPIFYEEKGRFCIYLLTNP